MLSSIFVHEAFECVYDGLFIIVERGRSGTLSLLCAVAMFP